MNNYICPGCQAQLDVHGVPVVNTSGSVEVVGSTTRHVERGDLGRFVPRRSTQVGALGPAGGIGPGGLDSVSGRWIPNVARHDVLFRDPLDFERVTHVRADYSGYAALSSMMDSGQYPRHLRVRT